MLARLWAAGFSRAHARFSRAAWRFVRAADSACQENLAGVDKGGLGCHFIWMMSRKTILCVEDETDFCELITLILDEFTVINAKSKAEALAKALDGSFDLYVVDYHLPDGTGLELSRLIRSFDSATPIFLISGDTSIAWRQVKAGQVQRLLKKGHAFVDELQLAVTEIFASQP